MSRCVTSTDKYSLSLIISFLIAISSLGAIQRETLGLITMPLILIKSAAPLLLSRTHRPLIIYARTYIPRLILCLLVAIFVFYSVALKQYPIYFYTILIVLLAVNDAIVYVQGAARGGFFAYISDTRIGSTYYTLLASLNNIGLSVSSTVVLHTANWLPKDKAYFIEVAVCLVLGSVWLCVSWRLMHRLQELPVERWHITPNRQNNDALDQQATHDKQSDASIINTNTTLLSC
jgi:MFS transporter, PAT family, solute carrier family 33 (acetyl-CoA transportor), member 1